MCCPGPPVCCDCTTDYDDLVMTGDTGSLTGPQNACPDMSFTMSGGTINGVFVFASTVVCEDGVWTFAGTAVPSGPFSVALDWDGDCETILLTGSFGGGTVTAVAAAA